MVNKSTQKLRKYGVKLLQHPTQPLSTFFPRLLPSAGRSREEADLCRCTAEVWRRLTAVVESAGPGEAGIRDATGRAGKSLGLVR